MIETIKQMVEALEWCHGGEPVGTAEAIKAGKKLIAELKSQEPDKYTMDIECTKCGAKQSGVLTVNTHPPQRKPLTDEQILANETLRYHFGLNGGAGPVSKKGRAVIDAIEAAHGIKE